MFYIILLILLEVILFALNYSQGTYLIGWDNVMPEFNISLNFQRGIFSIWQEYRGLGLLDGMAHSANLLHTFYIFILSLFLPQSLLRYVFIFLTHLAGGIGMFFLLKELLGIKEKRLDMRGESLAAFLGAFFYMFNLGIIQMYYAPLEAFAVHFAALPALTLFIIKSLKNPNKKNYLLLFVISLIFTPQSFITPLFIVISVLFAFLLFFSFIYLKNIKNILITALIFFCANAFWLIPYAYSIPQNASIIHNAKINQLSTDEIYFRNKAFGELLDVLTFKGFMLDGLELDKNKNVVLMEQWVNHQDLFVYNLISFLILGIVLLGLFEILLKRRKGFYPFIPPFLIAFLFLANNTPVVDLFSLFIKTYLPVLGEAFRFPFTKFITLFVFCFSIFFAYGVYSFSRIFSKLGKTLSIILTLFILFSAIPAFKGYFISPLLKTEIPNDYFDAFKYFQSIDKNQRVLILPAHTFWNWQYRSFGQRGSGFLWYGINQPILERAFDPWSNYDEQSYNEIAYAINTFDSKLFQSVIEKYDIKYIFLDQYLQDTLLKQPINYDRLKDFLNESKLVKENEFGKIIVYSTQVKNPWIYTLNKAMKIYPNFKYDGEDLVFGNFKNYIVENNNPDITPLFPSFYTGKLQEDMEFEARENNETITFSSKQDFNGLRDILLELPSLYEHEFLIPVSITVLKDQIILNPLYPKIYINGKQIISPDEKIIIIPSFVKNPKTVIFSDLNYNVDLSLQNKGFLLGKYPNSIKLKDGDSEEIISIDTKSISSKSYFVNINDPVNSVKIIIDKINGPFSIEDIISEKGYQIKEPNTLYSDIKKVSKAEVTENGSVNFEVRGDARELVFYKDNLFHQASYILFVETKYVSGLPINFYIDNALENRPEIETRLSKNNTENALVIPKTEEYFKGYGFHFIVKSVGTELAKSSIEKISLYPFPMTTLKNIKLMNSNFLDMEDDPSRKEPVDFEKTGNFLYKTEISDNDEILVLSQAYDAGWNAFRIQNSEFRIQNWINQYFPFIFGKEIGDHVLVNNWENGWELNSKFKIQNSKSTSIIIIFWPQYLEFAGFGMVLTVMIFIILYKPSKHLH